MSDGERYQPGDVYMDEGVIRLPHQCSEWSIGERPDALALMVDLRAMLGGDPHALVQCPGVWGVGWPHAKSCQRLVLRKYKYCPQHRP